MATLTLVPAPGAADVVPQQLLGEHRHGEQEQHGASEGVQLAHL